MFTAISSAQNPRVKNLVRLRDARHRRRQERFLIEGQREVQRALETGWPLEALFFCPDIFGPDSAALDLVERCDQAGIEAVQLSSDAFRKATYRESPDGLLAVGHARQRSLDALPLGPVPFLLIVERIEKPGNLGALMRTANAAAVDALVVCDPVCDVFNPNAIRASQGAFFHLPFVATDTITARLWLDERGIKAVALAPEASRIFWDLDLRQPIALLVGAEDAGLSADWREGNGVTAASLPMAGITDSLNVSVAAGIALFETVRQRRA